ALPTELFRQVLNYNSMTLKIMQVLFLKNIELIEMGYYNNTTGRKNYEIIAAIFKKLYKRNDTWPLF
ncbi:hypothetical protein, partial [Traorella massiliensis]|uniref:hypothetical protein n=1 Tax=Traorella massiliensis TaxID=1903263 RepID=UPI00248E9FE0